LFKIVEEALGGVPKDHNIYRLVEEGGDPNVVVPLEVRDSNFTYVGEPRKRVKREEEEE
jgi:hypothetical protein